MSKLNLSNFAKNISAKLGANAPGITIGLGTGAILVAGVMVGVATPKAMKLIEDAQVAKTKRFEKMYFLCAKRQFFMGKFGIVSN